MKRARSFFLPLFLLLMQSRSAGAAPEISVVSLAADARSPVLIYGSGFAGSESQAAFYAAAWEGKAEDKEEAARREASLKRYLAGMPEMKAPTTLSWARVMAGDANTVAAATPFDGPHLVQVRSGKEASKAFIVNRPEVWGLSPRSPRPGDVLTVWGPNLGNSFYLVDGSGKAVFLQGQLAYNYHSGRPEGRFVKLVDIPDNLAPGSYRLYSHWGRSDAGWSEGASLTVKAFDATERPVISVRAEGAVGNGTTDDTEAVLAAVKKAAPVKGIVFFEAGRYIISRSIVVPSGVDLTGVSREASVIEASSVKPFDVSATPFKERFPSMVVIQPGTKLENLKFDMTAARGSLSRGQVSIVMAVNGGSGQGPEMRSCNLWAETSARYAGYPGSTVTGFLVWATTQDLVFEGNEVTVTGMAFNPTEPITGARIRFNIFRHHSPHSNAATFGLQTPRECLVEGNIWENTGRGITQNSMPAHAWTLKHNLYMHNIFRNLRKTDGEIIYFETGGVSWNGNATGVNGRRITLAPAPDYDKIGQSQPENPIHGTPKGVVNRLPRRTVFISEGKGLGQMREITGTDGAVIEIDRPWDALPDANSRLLILTGSVVENLLVGNEYIDCHQWVGIFGAGVRNAWVNDTYERVSGGLDLWKIHGLRQMSLNLIYGNKMHQRAGIAVVNDRAGGAEDVRVQVFGNEIRNNSIEERAYISSENGQNAPRLLGWQVRRDGSYKTNALAPLPGREPGIGIFDMIGHPEMGALETDPAFDALVPSSRWNLIYGNQIARCPIGIEVGKAVEHTIITGNLFLQTELPINDMGRDTAKVGNTVYNAVLPKEQE